MLTPVNNDHLIGKRVSLTPESASTDNWKSEGLDETSVLTISSVQESGVSFSAVKITVRDETGQEHVALANELFIL